MERKEATHSLFVAYLLWIVGFIGVHRFYFGKKITGVIWFCTLGLLGIGWIIDLFLIPSMSREASVRYTTGLYDYTVGWLLLAFGGVFGLHRFYLGKIATGLIFLITFGLFGLGLLYDLFTFNEQIDIENRLTKYP